MQTLLSKPVVERLDALTKESAARLINEGIDPHLAVVMLGDDPASQTYVRMKSERARKLGIIASVYELPEGTPISEVRASLEFLAQDPDVHGIIIQLPLPGFSDEQTDQLISLIPAHKDVDGLSGAWTAELPADPPRSIDEFLSYGGLLPATMLSVLSLLDQYSIDVRQGKTVLVGDGRLVGHPLSLYLHALGSDVQTVDETTDHILDITRSADLLITGTGQADLITYQWIKEGATVVNCALDVHEDSVKQLAGALAPGVGAVGPLTIAWLLHNLIQAAEGGAI